MFRASCDILCPIRCQNGNSVVKERGGAVLGTQVFAGPKHTPWTVLRLGMRLHQQQLTVFDRVGERRRCRRMSLNVEQPAIGTEHA